ncbi:hypothetical protein BOTCAL_0276g00060 [Botryotinia calthae]|uniref:Uncharacterized protein n=1 Tax=Botryotinia calthae TaxID=38488 RepID=A0A4Y8CY41_9HELO|nr:hypothetical protein BOTCAL_0276g00060 [Botryotinia calthae]
MCIYTYSGKMSKLAGTSESIRTPVKDSPELLGAFFILPSLRMRLHKIAEITRDYQRLPKITKDYRDYRDYQRLPEIELAIGIYHKLY